MKYIQNEGSKISQFQSEVSDFLWHLLISFQVESFLVNNFISPLERLGDILFTGWKNILFQNFLFNYSILDLSLHNLGATVFLTVFLFVLLFFVEALSFLDVSKIFADEVFQVRSSSKHRSFQFTS